MARLVTKFKYLKVDQEKPIGGYATYIATREGMDQLKWYASFHNESHHPHIHLLAYSTVEKEGFLTKQGVAKMRSSLAKDIFEQDLLCIYERSMQ